MFERFTKPARSVVEAAVEQAHKTRAARVRPEHLFVALLEQDDEPRRTRPDRPRRSTRPDPGGGRGPGAIATSTGSGTRTPQALATIGIDLEEVLRRVDPEPGEDRQRVRTRFSREAKKVMELSLREAVALQHSYIGTEHILLGLVREGDPLVHDALTALGVTQKGLRAAVADAVRKAG